MMWLGDEERELEDRKVLKKCSGWGIDSDETSTSQDLDLQARYNDMR